MGGFKTVYLPKQDLIFGATNYMLSADKYTYKGSFRREGSSYYSYSPSEDFIYLVKGLTWSVCNKVKKTPVDTYTWPDRKYISTIGYKDHTPKRLSGSKEVCFVGNCNSIGWEKDSYDIWWCYSHLYGEKSPAAC